MRMTWVICKWWWYNGVSLFEKFTNDVTLMSHFLDDACLIPCWFLCPIFFLNKGTKSSPKNINSFMGPTLRAMYEHLTEVLWQIFSLWFWFYLTNHTFPNSWSVVACTELWPDPINFCNTCFHKIWIIRAYGIYMISPWEISNHSHPGGKEFVWKYQCFKCIYCSASD